MLPMIASRPTFRSLALAFALAAAPSLLLAQSPTGRSSGGGSRPQADRPAPSQRPTAEPRRPDRQPSADRGRPPGRSTGEPELKRRKP
jgi:hypothetical protein